MINFDKLPKEKPNQINKVDPGTYEAIVHDAKMVVSSNTGNEYLRVTFKTSKDEYVSENYFDQDNDFLRWKLSNLLVSCGIDLEIEGTLKDIAKLVKNKKLIIDVTINDREYPCLDYTGDKHGTAPLTVTSVEEKEVEVNSNDEDY